MTQYKYDETLVDEERLKYRNKTDSKIGKAYRRRSKMKVKRIGKICRPRKNRMKVKQTHR